MRLSESPRASVTVISSVNSDEALRNQPAWPVCKSRTQTRPARHITGTINLTGTPPDLAGKGEDRLWCVPIQCMVSTSASRAAFLKCGLKASERLLPGGIRAGLR